MKLARIYDVKDKIIINDATDAEKIEHYRKMIEGSYETIEKNMEYFKKLPPQYGKSIRDNKG
jgi:5'(3')-deoxyribonucleotidase